MAVGVAERLRQARTTAGETLDALARRTGARAEHLRAIEDGRFGDLPSGIYGRSAVRSFAAAYQLDPSEAVAGCEAMLPAVDDPIAALARLAGLRAPEKKSDAATVRSEPNAGWLSLAASAVDACVVAALLAALVACAALQLRVPVAALSAVVMPLLLLGGVIAAGYFVWFGGLIGTTVGEFAVRSRARGWNGRVTWRLIGARAMRAATADVRGIVNAAARISPQPGLWPAPLPLRGRAPGPPSPANPPAAERHARLPRRPDRTPPHSPSTAS
jgi:hypothetical protein